MALDVASTIHALDETAVALRPATKSEPLSAPLVRGATRPTRYESQGRLGEGGMGTVDAVWDADLMRHLAVKRLRPELREDARMVRQFLWEARVTAHLDHPNIIPIHDLAVGQSGNVFFTMKRARGRTLEEALHAVREKGEDELSLARRLRIFIQVCHAVSFAHARGVLHRDLKPANVMLGEHGEVLLMDWGLARPLPGPSGDALRALRADAAETEGSSGTPLYMSPEQVKNALLDERSDVYTLGVILYELVSHAHPYDAKSLPALLAAIVAGDAKPLAKAAPSASRSIVAVVEQAMNLDPAKRYASVEALREDVERVLDGHTPKAEQASVVRRFARLYMARDRGLSRLRVMDLEVMLAASLLSGVAGTGIALTGDRWPWLVALAAAITWVPPTVRWWREREARDE